ncbi:MAG: hypothetical protein JW976_07965 [Syntrophaceae bacterium]|nr:hypothetical protein [Syntrophaceae bacterium]
MKPSKHKLFSSQAALIYKACTGKAIPEKLIKAFGLGSVNEDYSGLTRAVNWHFYNRDKKIGHYWKFFLFCNGSNENIFKERISSLEKMIISRESRQKIYEIAGRIAHHIQDMSSPPHVMPIYHVGNDKFDNYEFVDQRVADAVPVYKDVMMFIEPFDLLERAAQNTIKAVAEPVVFNNGKVIKGETWMKFWGGPDDKQLSGFKTYGKYGNVFGSIPLCESDVCREYNRDTFDRFYAECYKRAVTDTVRLLIYLDRQIKD